MLELVKKYLLDLQNQICCNFEALDLGYSFYRDPWQRSLSGDGVTCILTGSVLEKVGVNFSHIYGLELPAAATARCPELIGHRFHAMGVSIVSHPYNPYVPTAHANVRFFIVENDHAPPVWWFGGGFDLTPYYGFVEDCQHWHQTAKQACQPFGHDLYQRFKQNCDRYFFLKHRREARGIGGLFFDDFNEGGFEHSFELMKSIGDHFMQGYVPIIIKRKDLPFGEREKKFQLYRRGRYVEFNLVYDRGTLFGLQSEGRTESILMSLPSQVCWEYNWQPTPGSAEAKLYTDFLPVRDWVG